MTSGLGPHINYIVRCADNLLIMLHNHNGVSYLLQLAQYLYQLLCIAAVQADAGFVKYVERTHQAAAK